MLWWNTAPFSPSSPWPPTPLPTGPQHPRFRPALKPALGLTAPVNPRSKALTRTNPLVIGETRSSEHTPSNGWVIIYRLRVVRHVRLILVSLSWIDECTPNPSWHWISGLRKQRDTFFSSSSRSAPSTKARESSRRWENRQSREGCLLKFSWFAELTWADRTPGCRWITTPTWCSLCSRAASFPNTTWALIPLRRFPRSEPKYRLSTYPVSQTPRKEVLSHLNEDRIRR